MTNVIMFPKAKRDSTPIQNMEELIEKTTAARKEHIELLIDEAMTAIFERCYDEGFDLTLDEVVKPTCLMVESFRSMLQAAIGVEHPLQTTAEQIFVEKNQNDNGVEDTPE